MKEEDEKKNTFSPHSEPHPVPPTLPATDLDFYLDEKREGRGNEREGRLSLAHFPTRVRKELVDGKEEEKKAAESVENIFGRLSNSPFRPPPPYHTPYPLTRLIEPFDER